jgi:hypothetical protein
MWLQSRDVIKMIVYRTRQLRFEHLNIYKESLILDKILSNTTMCSIIYTFDTFKLFSSIISSQFFRKWILDSFNDIDLFDLKTRSFFSLNKHVSFKQLISKQIVNSSRTQSSRSYERKYQNELFIRNNAIERFFRVSNITERNEKSANF